MKNILRNLIPKRIRLFILRSLHFPKVGNVKPINFFSTEPISRKWGARGTPVDRYYIEKFLLSNATDIKGRVLEIGDNFYTKKYGGEKVLKSEILHAVEISDATYVGDLTDIPQIPSDTFDCIILTQTLQLIADLDSAINTLHRVLKNNGFLLITVPGISKIYIDEEKRWPDYWRFTKNSANWLLNKKFKEENIEVESFGNVLTSVAFLHGLAFEELSTTDLDYNDELFQMLITIKVKKVI